MSISKLDIHNIPYDDAATWQLLQQGINKGLFQLESRLCRIWLQKLKPNNIWELSLLIAAIRPGVLMSGLTDEIYHNKFHPDEIRRFGHPTVDQIFAQTHNVLCYQEQLMSLGMKLAWPHLPEKEKLLKVDKLRKAVGKKKQDAILEIGKDFKEGCLHNKVDEELVDRLFDIIKNSGRYLFNLSHSISYAYIAYQTAYFKTHYPLQFYATYLSYAKYRPDTKEEIRDLTYEMLKLGIPLLGPNINKKNPYFSIEGGGIRYGLTQIKFFGTSTIEHISDLPTINHWHQVLRLLHTDHFGFKLRSDTATALISVGAFSDIGISRKTLLNINSITNKLTKRELDLFFDKLIEYPNLDDFPKLIESIIEQKSIGKRKNMLKEELQFLKLNEYDDPAWVEQKERQYLYVPVTCTAIDGLDTSCYDFCKDCSSDCPEKTNKTVAVIINEIKPTITKSGKNPGSKMARINVHDTTGVIENILVFPNCYSQFSNLLINRNTILIKLVRGKDAWIAQEIAQL